MSAAKGIAKKKTGATQEQPIAHDVQPVVSDRRSRSGLYGAIAVVVLLVAVGVVYGVHRHHDNTKKLTVQAATTKASAQGTLGKYSAAQSTLDQGLTVAKTNTDKGSVYEQKSEVAFESGDYKNALAYSKMAEAMHPTTNSAQDIAQSSKALNDKQTALKYYKLELQRAGKAIGPDDNLDITTNISALEAQQ